MELRYTNISVSHDAKADLAAFQARLIGLLGRRVNLGDTLRVAVTLADKRDADAIRDAAAMFGLIEPPTESNGETQ